MCVRLVRFWYEYGEIGESMTMAWWLPLPRRTPALLQLGVRRHSRRMGWQTPDHCGRTHNITESVLEMFRRYSRMGLQGIRHTHAGGIEGRPMTILDRKRAGHSKKKRCFRETQMCVFQLLHIIWCKRFCPLVF